jgi:hypothetical protein
LDGLLVHGEGVGVIEQAPGNEATGHDRGAVGAGTFRLAVFNQICRVLGPQLLIASALDVPAHSATWSTRFTVCCELAGNYIGGLVEFIKHLMDSS